MAARYGLRSGLPAMIALATWFSACDPLSGKNARDDFFVSIRLDSSQYAYDLRVLLVAIATTDTLDTVFIGRAKDSADLARLPAHRYRGGPVDAVIWGFQDGKFQWVETLRYLNPEAAPAKRKVSRRAFEPVLSLPTGAEKDTVFLAPGETVRIDTPSCVGYRKERLKVDVTDSLHAAIPGSYAIRYTCEDAFGYRTEGARSFRVLPPDSLGPYLTVVGRDTLRSLVGESVRPLVTACADYKRRPLEVKKEGAVDSIHLGFYPVTYSCQDTSLGRRSEVGRVFVVVPARNRFALFRATQETGINMDLAEGNINNGYNACLPLARLNDKGDLSTNGYLSFIQFDLAQAQALNPVAARLRLRVFGTGGAFRDSTYRCRIEVDAEKVPWTEGHGNMYYYDKSSHLNADSLFKYYPFADSIKAASRNPMGADGLLYSAGDTMSKALDTIWADTLGLHMTPLHGLKSVPKPENLLTVEIDLTRYVLSRPADKHHGFVVKFSGLPDNQGLSFLTKEAGDGSYAPELVIEY